MDQLLLIDLVSCMKNNITIDYNSMYKLEDRNSHLYFVSM